MRVDCDLSFSNVNFTNVGVLEFGAYMLMIQMSCWGIFFIYEYRMSFHVSLIDFGLKSTFLDIEMTTPA